MRAVHTAMIVLSTAVVAACGGEARSQDAGPSVERDYQVAQFSRIEVAGPYDVTVRTGSAPSVSASGPQTAVERMVVEVDGDTLRIHPEKRSGMRIGWSRDRTVRLTVTVPNLVGAAIAGSGDIEIDRVAGDAFDGSVAGSGDLRLGSLEVERSKMAIAGSGEIRVGEGRAGQAGYEIAGSGDIDMGSFTTNNAEVAIMGSGNISTNATRTASVDIAGSGNVRIRGGAQCRVSKAGSGNVDCG